MWISVLDKDVTGFEIIEKTWMKILSFSEPLNLHSTLFPKLGQQDVFTYRF